MPQSTEDLLKQVEPPRVYDVHSLTQTYRLFYIHGNSRNIQDVNFSFPGNFKEAISKGRSFCEQTGWKFIKVEPFLIDLGKFVARQNISEL